MATRFGILGAGGISRRFASVLKECGCAELSAVAARDLDRAEAFARKFGANAAYGDYDALLADPAVVKAGVAIGDDMRELARLYPFKPAGMVDLGMVARAHQLTTQGLRTLAANLFGQRISKGPQCSNWSVMELSKRQVIYAATDAWIGRAIYLRMRELGMTGEAA